MRTTPFAPPVLAPGAVATLRVMLHAAAGGDALTQEAVALLLRLCESHEEIRRRLLTTSESRAVDG